MSPEERDRQWMQFAQSLARHAASIGEVPVGAILVADERIVASGFNLRETIHQATAHAELLAIEEASRIRRAWRLSDCELYVTLEPCVMCAGAIHQSRLKRVIFGAFDLKGGALGSLYRLHEDQRLNHRYPVQGGILQDECSLQLSSFFADRRRQKALKPSTQELPPDQQQSEGDE